MLSQSQANAYNLKPQMVFSLENPFFARDRPLWTKTNPNIPSNYFKNARKYEFTKVGKTFGFQTTRFLALSNKVLYYFDLESDSPLGSCDIQNVYSEWTKLAQNRFMLVLNNGCESTVYFFITDDFIRENKNELAKFTVQLGFFQKFNIIEELGEGSFASVYRANDKLTNEQFSAKVFSRSTSFTEILRQIQILRQIVGVPNVCQYSGLFQTDQEIIIVTKYIHGKDLKTFMRYSNGLEQNDIKAIILGICNGLKQCHKQNIIHRDIKPQNIIIDFDTMQPTIIDFGLSLDVKKPFTLNRCGTSAYMAPEVYNFPQKKQPYNNKCDIFSLGVLSHLLMLGNNPLKVIKEGDKDYIVCRKSPLKWKQLQAKNLWGEEGYQFLQKTLNICTKSRWDISDVLVSSFLGQSKENSLKKVESCSTIQDRFFEIDIDI